MTAFVLMIPLFLIRFGLLGILNKAALSRAAFFAPLKGAEKSAYLFYQASNAFIILYPFFLKIQTKPSLFLIGLCAYALGTGILAVSTIDFAKPEQSGINRNGIYRLSRNPMYLGYFVYFLGCVLLTRSIVLLLALLVFQISAHWIILAEERWCVDTFGNAYIDYMNKVRRYI